MYGVAASLAADESSPIRFANPNPSMFQFVPCGINVANMQITFIDTENGVEIAPVKLGPKFTSYYSMTADQLSNPLQLVLKSDDENGEVAVR